MSGPGQTLDERTRAAEWLTSYPGLAWYEHQLRYTHNAWGQVVADLEHAIATVRESVDAGDADDDTLAMNLLAENSRDAWLRMLEPEGVGDENGGVLGRLTARAERLRQAQAYWIAGPMVSLTDAAYSSRPPEPLAAGHLPSPDGYAWLAHSATVQVDGCPAFSAVAWERGSFTDRSGELRTGVRLTWWMPFETMTELVSRELSSGEVIRTEYARAVLGHSVPQTVFWEFGYDAPGGPSMIDRYVAHIAHWVQTFWILSSQPLVTITQGDVDRHARKRAERAGVDPKVSVVTLRRAAGDRGPGDGSGRDWKHRWVVRGFWRRQWYPSANEHRTIWIDDYIKGPEDRPFLVREKVYAWRR